MVSLNWRISLTANLEETDMNLMLSRILCEQSAAPWAVEQWFRVRTGEPQGADV